MVQDVSTEKFHLLNLLYYYERTSHNGVIYNYPLNVVDVHILLLLKEYVHGRAANARNGNVPVNFKVLNVYLSVCCRRQSRGQSGW